MAAATLGPWSPCLLYLVKLVKLRKSLRIPLLSWLPRLPMLIYCYVCVCVCPNKSEVFVSADISYIFQNYRNHTVVTPTQLAKIILNISVNTAVDNIFSEMSGHISVTHRT
jgi:hypothetical protein